MSQEGGSSLLIVVGKQVKVGAFQQVAACILVNGSAGTRAKGVVAPFQESLENERRL